MGAGLLATFGTGLSFAAAFCGSGGLNTIIGLQKSTIMKIFFSYKLQCYIENEKSLNYSVFLGILQQDNIHTPFFSY